MKRHQGWLTDWNPEDEDVWAAGGHKVARRNLFYSVASEHVAFSVWTLWSVLALFMSPESGLNLDPSQKFLLVTTPTLVGALLRLPYSYAVTRMGGRNWTVLATLALLVPTALATWLIQQPGTPLWALVAVAALAGIGGGNFASSMTNVTAFYPQRHQGWALGLNAGGGNLGVAVVQLLGLAVATLYGVRHPAYIACIYLPVIVITAVMCGRYMDNVAAVRTPPGAQREAARTGHTWLISALYVGTFGSFIGYGFAFGLVLQNQFGATPVQAVSYTFLGPLLGSLTRPLGGRLADRCGAARVTFWTFLAMAAGTGVLVVAATWQQFGLFVAGFVTLFVLSGIGNGSTYKLIPVVFAAKAEQEVTAGADASEAFARQRRLAGAVIAIAGAVGAVGGAAINFAFKLSYSGHHASGIPAFCAFIGYYAACMLLLRAVYLRKPTAQRAAADRERARV
ncbi:major facilitator transporter [Streptomyces hygroscopicus]|uniref:MFS transporter n=1 Tax=Streptomyces hygroscopicus TaxID=1912 RepID=UPI0022407E93|nr:MFS transporter [Streptomyces hygroscopicus]MCW7944410.1 major facilitator transporter [Streptomyces hygroscopicus]